MQKSLHWNLRNFVLLVIVLQVVQNFSSSLQWHMNIVQYFGQRQCRLWREYEPTDPLELVVVQPQNLTGNGLLLQPKLQLMNPWVWYESPHSSTWNSCWWVPASLAMVVEECITGTQPQCQAWQNLNDRFTETSRWWTCQAWQELSVPLVNLHLRSRNRLTGIGYLCKPAEQ